MNTEVDLYLVKIRHDRIDTVMRVEKMAGMSFSGRTYIRYGRRIAKEKLMKIDTEYYRTHKQACFFTYALLPDVPKAIELLKAKVLEELEIVKAEFEKVYSRKDSVQITEPEYKDF